jgi:hypothetical protein
MCDHGYIPQKVACEGTVNGKLWPKPLAPGGVRIVCEVVATGENDEKEMDR